MFIANHKSSVNNLIIICIVYFVSGLKREDNSMRDITREGVGKCNAQTRRNQKLWVGDVCSSPLPTW